MTGTWEDCEIFETHGTVDEVQSCSCSVCGKYLTTPFAYYFNYYNYCPNCGAKMRKEGEQNGKTD